MDAFVLRVVLSFVLGGLAVALFTAAAERLGSRVGGILLSFPIKVAVAMLLMGLNEGAMFAADAARAIPLGIGVNVVFLLGTALAMRRLTGPAAIAVGLGAWLAAGMLAVFAAPDAAWVYGLAWLAPTAAGVWLLDHARGERRAKPKDTFGLAGMLSRALGAGTIVALALVLARFAGPLVGGLASVFPSGWITTMVILTRHHGAEFTAATTRVMIAGSAAPVAFGVAVATAFPVFGVVGGTLVAVAVATFVSLGVMATLRVVDGTRKR